MTIIEQLVGGSSVRAGQPAPRFSLPDQDGRRVSLDDLLGETEVVLFFYPMNNTAGCTAEACAFRDSYEDFVAAGARVVGISSDSVRSHQQFAGRHRLPYTLLSDADGQVRRQYGASHLFGLQPGRITYIIDRQGIVRHVFSALLQAQAHVDEALRALNAIRQQQ